MIPLFRTSYENRTRNNLPRPLNRASKLKYPNHKTQNRMALKYSIQLLRRRNHFRVLYFGFVWDLEFSV